MLLMSAGAHLCTKRLGVPVSKGFSSCALFFFSWEALGDSL